MRGKGQGKGDWGGEGKGKGKGKGKGDQFLLFLLDAFELDVGCDAGGSQK